MADHTSLRLAATLLFLGELFSLLVGMLHPSRENPNNHRAVFAEYAHSANWTAVHLGQFVGLALIIAGLLAIFFALSVRGGALEWMSRFGAVAAIVTLALTGVLYAVDGVALKQAVNAWASAPATEKTAFFASAEAIRWLEWGVRSYQSCMLGLALLLFAIVIVWATSLPKPIGYLMGLSGLAYIAQGWVLGTQGFSAANTIPQLLGYLLIIIWSIWLLVTAWRTKEPAPVVSESSAH